MDKLSEINEYIKNLKIKKSFFGGYDKTEVEMRFEELLVMFKKCLEEEREIHNSKLAEYESKIQTSQMMFNEINKKLCTVMEEQREMEKEKEQMKSAYKEYCTNILQQYSESLRTLSSEFTQILENISNLQQNMIEMDVFDKIVIGIEEKEIEQIEINE